MADTRRYYQAYDDRYAQVHRENLVWFSEKTSPIVKEVMERYAVSKEAKILEIGCGEGRDARFLLESGYHVLATDVSDHAIAFCRKAFPEYASDFATLDCLTERLDEKFSFIYAIAVIHMLLLDEDRDGFYRFLGDQLMEDGIALVCSMGDGIAERSSDITTAFALQERLHEDSGRILKIAGTSYRAVNFEAFQREIERNGLQVLETGLTDVQPDYYKMMYAVIRKA